MEENRTTLPPRRAVALIAIARPVNVAMAGAAVALGFWLAKAPGSPWTLSLLIVATAAATAFGNVVNDLRDIATDRVSHPSRPLPLGTLSPISATVYAVVLALLSAFAAAAVSRAHALGAVAAMTLLLLYALTLKRVPLAGNLTVATLVAYPLLFGGLQGPALGRLCVPALLALLLNVSREIVKDLEDIHGDHAAGYRTSASIPIRYLHGLLAATSMLYLGLLFAPTVLGYFGTTYAAVCALVVLPLHVWRSRLLFGSTYRDRLHRISALVKIEMLAGLAALVLDESVRSAFIR